MAEARNLYIKNIAGSKEINNILNPTHGIRYY